MVQGGGVRGQRGGLRGHRLLAPAVLGRGAWHSVVEGESWASSSSIWTVRDPASRHRVPCSCESCSA
eukprot:scaffold21531_cov63-Phaeocystis_antarctica.AAC.8